MVFKEGIFHEFQKSISICENFVLNMLFEPFITKSIHCYLFLMICEIPPYQKVGIGQFVINLSLERPAAYGMCFKITVLTFADCSIRIFLIFHELLHVLSGNCQWDSIGLCDNYI